MDRSDAKRPARHRYQHQDSAMTLGEGLAEYYAANAGVVMRPADLAPESASLFRNHDMCHVVFGLDTTLADEAIADTRTLLSCDVGVRRYVRYLRTDAHANALFAELGVWSTIKVTLGVTPRVFRAIRESWRMKRRWPWEPPASFLERTLADLRAEFAIRVI